MLAAFMAKRAAKLGAAIEAFCLMGKAVGADFACLRLDRSADNSAGHRVAEALQIPIATPRPQH